MSIKTGTGLEGQRLYYDVKMKWLGSAVVMGMCVLGRPAHADQHIADASSPVELVAVQILPCSILYFTSPTTLLSEQLLWLRKILAYLYAPERLEFYKGKPITSDDIKTLLESVHGRAAGAPANPLMKDLHVLATPSTSEIKRYLAQTAFQHWAGPDLMRELNLCTDHHGASPSDDFAQIEDLLKERFGVEKDEAEFDCN